MIVIKRDNYEQFFIDYLEGNLSYSEVDQLKSFLIANPDLKQELDEIENQRLVPEINTFHKKSVLKKEPVLAYSGNNNFNELCIARIERDLNQIQLTEFNKLIEDNPNLKKQFALFEKTVLIPDTTITFNKKSSLRKSVFVTKRKVVYQYLSVAASVALLIALSVFVPKNIHDNDKNNSQLSSINNEKDVAVAKENNSVVQEIQKEFSINQNLVIDDNQSAKETNNINFSVEEINVKTRELIQPLVPSSIKIVENENMFIADLKIVDLSSYKTDPKTISSEPNSLKDVLVRSFNKRVLKKESDLNTINTYDFADLAITGVNKIAGTKMSLNKKYDASGNVTDLEFNSRLIAFSTPVKK
jgi:hypothetical protein